MSRLRLFAALPVDDRLADRIMALKTPISRSTEANLRFIERDNLHLTVVFLGETEADSLGGLKEILERGAGALPAPLFVPGTLAPFPSAKRARGIQLGIEDSGGSLQALYGLLTTALQRAGYAVDDRGYRPHITVARVRGRRGAFISPDCLPAPGAGQSRRSEELVLYQSQLSSAGASYRSVGRYTFSAR